MIQIVNEFLGAQHACFFFFFRDRFSHTVFVCFTGLATLMVAAEHQDGDDPLQWLRDSIPGEPGVDYPIFSAVEETAFSCEDKVFGGKS